MPRNHKRSRKASLAWFSCYHNDSIPYYYDCYLKQN